MKKHSVILGAGISGISAGYHHNESNSDKVILLEKNTSYGGLLDNIKIGDFTFDTFVHLSFTKNEYVKDLFAQSSKFIVHKPEPFNYVDGKWIKHPVQNNLNGLPLLEKIKILSGFITRPKIKKPLNYEDWLVSQYGAYFYRKYPLIYTLKYWRTHPRDMEVDWVGSRMYKPNLFEVVEGVFRKKTPNVYYATEMRYPTSGGFKSFLSYMVKDLDIRYSSEVVKIDIDNKQVTCINGEIYNYEKLISSLPLPIYLELINNIPSNVVSAIKKFKWTSAVIISMGFNKPNITDKLWFYIYDEDIKASRMHSPSMKSSKNAPDGCSSLQSEIYFTKEELKKISLNDLIEGEINQYIDKGIIEREHLLFYEYKVVEFANVIFDHYIYESRDIVINWLLENGITSIGRFGQWDYFWTDDSLLSGKILNES